MEEVAADLSAVVGAFFASTRMRREKTAQRGAKASSMKSLFFRLKATWNALSLLCMQVYQPENNDKAETKGELDVQHAGYGSIGVVWCGERRRMADR